MRRWQIYMLPRAYLLISSCHHSSWREGLRVYNRYPALATPCQRLLDDAPPTLHNIRSLDPVRLMQDQSPRSGRRQRCCLTRSSPACGLHGRTWAPGQPRLTSCGQKRFVQPTEKSPNSVRGWSTSLRSKKRIWCCSSGPSHQAGETRIIWPTIYSA